MDDLADRIRASLGNPNAELWFPELTADLADRAWVSLQRDIGLTPENYGTARVMSRNSSAPRFVMATLPSSLPGSIPMIDIEALSDQCASQYHKAGISFYSLNEIRNSEILSCIADALRILSQVPSLMRTIAGLVRSLHLIKPDDSEYDVSFSEPYIPFSIFISVPDTRIANDALRVAEAILHEAMHLQLTIIDQLAPLVRSTREKHFSPWKATHRSVEGVLHALYVFRVIDRVLGLWPLESIQPEVREYIQKRHLEINRQIDMIRSLESCAALTITGGMFVRSCLVSVNRQPNQLSAWEHL